MNHTRSTLAGTAAACLVLALAACSSPADEGWILSIEDDVDGNGCQVRIAGNGDDGTEDASHRAPEGFCRAAQPGMHAEFEDGEAELNFGDEDDD